jgi:hypothetical protein
VGAHTYNTKCGVIFCGFALKCINWTSKKRRNLAIRFPLPAGASHDKIFQKLNRKTQIKRIDPFYFSFLHYLLSLIGGKRIIRL